MRPVALVLLAVVHLCASCREPAAPERPETTVAYSDLGFANNVYFLNEDAFTGRATRDYPGGQRELEYGFRNGRLDGVAREWYEDGTPKTETHFSEGKRHGTNTYWNEDGSVQKEQVWEKGKLVSEHKP